MTVRAGGGWPSPPPPAGAGTTATNRPWSASRSCRGASGSPESRTPRTARSITATSPPITGWHRHDGSTRAGSAEQLPVLRRVPVGLVRLDREPPVGLVDETGHGPGTEPGEGRELRCLPEGRPLVEVAGVGPEHGEVDQPPCTDPGHRVVPEVKPGQRRPEPHVRLGHRRAEQVTAGRQPLLQVLQGAGP